MPAIDYRAARAQFRLADVLELIGYQVRYRQGKQLRGAARYTVHDRRRAVRSPPTWARTCFTVSLWGRR